MTIMIILVAAEELLEAPHLVAVLDQDVGELLGHLVVDLLP